MPSTVSPAPEGSPARCIPYLVALSLTACAKVPVANIGLAGAAVTLMQRLGVALDIIDRCQNHVLASSEARRHYLHHDYADEKRDAWAKLGEHIVSVLADFRSGA